MPLKQLPLRLLGMVQVVVLVLRWVLERALGLAMVRE